MAQFDLIVPDLELRHLEGRLVFRKGDDASVARHAADLGERQGSELEDEAAARLDLGFRAKRLDGLGHVLQPGDAGDGSAHRIAPRADLASDRDLLIRTALALAVDPAGALDFT